MVEATFRHLFEKNPDPMWVYDRETLAFLEVNEAAVEHYGYSRDEFLRMTLADIWPPEDVPRLRDTVARLPPGGRHVDDRRHRTKQGRNIDVDVTSYAVDFAGRTAHLVIVRDISERKRAAALLAGQNRTLEMIAGGAPLEEVLAVLMHVIEFESEDMFCSVLLLDEDGKHLRHGAAPSLPTAFIRAVDGLPIGPRAGSCGTAAYRRAPVIVTDILQDPLWEDFRQLAKPLGLRSCWSTPIFSQRGRVLGTFAMYYRDVRSPNPAEEKLIGVATHLAGIAIERKRAEAAIRESEKRFRNLADSVPALMWMSDADGHCIFVNLPWLTYTGRGLEQELGRGFADSIHPDDRDRVTVDEAQKFSAHKAFSIEYRLRRADGAYRWFLDTAAPRFTDDHGYLGHVGILVDVTERRDLLEQVQQMQRLEAIGQLTGGVAHDFNNLLTVILGNAELLRELAGNDRQLGPAIELVKAAAARGADLTQRLLAFARRQPLRPEAVDVNQLVAGMDQMLRRTLGEHIEIEFIHGARLWPALVDPAQLEAAVLNLALNARDAMPKGGRLTIETANHIVDEGSMSAELRPGRYVGLSVSDTGSGMSNEVHRRAFEPFFTTKGFGKGSGLGLSMVYGFVKQSEGHVRIDSQVGRGTSVRFYLPCAESEAMATATERSAPPSSPRGSETILVVEDDDLVRTHVEGQLHDLGYHVVAAPDGPSALRALAEIDQVDLLFTDVIMPGGLDGAQLAQEVHRRRPGLKVLFTSGYADNVIVRDGRLDSGIHLLSKPYRPQDLATKLRQLLDAE